jgi:phosphoribosyl-dephospho-CoA transferase
MELFLRINNPQVHDLVHVDPDSLSGIAAPSWVLPALQSCPWAVVRRAVAAPREMAIGVRGNTRDQRWGGFIRKTSVATMIRPQDLLTMHSSTFIPRTPAMRVLQRVIERWQDFSLPWGPTGSVAFELVSGQHVTTESSDLDIAIRAARRLSVERAKSLWQEVSDLRPGVDIRVETPECGFSLQEYACVSPARILLRYRDGVRLGNDPWSPRQVSVSSVV